MSIKLLCWPLSCMVLSPGHLSSPPPSHRALPSALATYHPKHPLEWFRHQHRGPSSGYVYQHWSHARQNTASLDRTCLRDRKPSPIKDHDIWRTSHWPSWQRNTSEKIQRHFENVHRHLQGQWTTQSTNRMNWRRTSSFKTRRRATMEDKRRRRKTGTLLTPPLNRPWRAAAVERCVYLGYVSSAISEPAPDVDFLIRESLFAKLCA